MTSTTHSLSILPTGRRLVGALSAAAAVALVGVTALHAGTAMAAGIHRGPESVFHAAGMDPAGLVDPVALSSAAAVTYRYDGNRFLRA